jgi:hypothetical protein
MARLAIFMKALFANRVGVLRLGPQMRAFTGIILLTSNLVPGLYSRVCGR